MLTNELIANPLFIQARYSHYIGDLIRARDFYNSLLMDYPEEEYIFYELGQIALQKKDYQDAERMFSRALEVGPKHTPTKFLLAKAKFYLRNYRDALEIMDEIWQEIPKHPAAFLYQIRCLGEMERWQELLEVFHAQEEIENGEIRLWYILALLKTGNQNIVHPLFDAISKSIRDRNPNLVRRIQEEYRGSK